MNDAVGMTANQVQQNISDELADDFLSTLLSGNVTEFSGHLATISNRS